MRRSLCVFFLLFLLAPACSRKTESSSGEGTVVPEDSVPLEVSVPLSTEVAAALNGVAEQDDLVADIFVNDERVSEGVRGGVRAGVRAGVRGGVRAAEASGVRGGVRGSAPRDPWLVARDSQEHPRRGELARPSSGEPRDTSNEKRQASDSDLAFAFEVTFFMPKRSARDGDNTFHTRVRPGRHADVPLVEVKTTVKMRVPPSPSPLPQAGEGGEEPGEGLPLFDIEIEETDIDVSEVDLPDLDGNGISTLTEVAVIISSEAIGGGRQALEEAIAIASDATSTQKPTQEQAQAAFQALATKLETKVVQDFKDAGVTPPATVKIEIKEIDLTPPDTFVTSNEGISFTFTCNESFCVWRCSLAGPEAFDPKSCATPLVLSLSKDGEYTLRVAASDALGNKDPTPAEIQFTVRPAIQCGNKLCETGETVDSCPADCATCGDTICSSTETETSCPSDCDKTSPDTSLVGAGLPALLSNQTSATFEFTSTEAGSTFMCQLDTGTPSSCISPLTVGAGFTPALSDGPHTFSVRGIDPAGNVDASPASHTWTVDTTPPDTTITAAPPALTNSTSASFTFTSPDSTAGFQCSLDSAAFSSCSSPFTVGAGLPALSDGPHNFAARAVDPAGNADPTPASYTWTIDLTAPSAAIGSQPSAVSGSTSASFSFSCSDPVGAGLPAQTACTFQCKLDSGSFSSCSSPTTLNSQPDGSHTFQVRAIDPAGNVGSPASYTWTIDLTAPTFAGLSSATAASSSQINLSWTAATDNVSASTAILYKICRSITSGSCQTSFTATYTTAAGSTSYSATALSAATAYYFVARAVDEVGNQDGNTIEKTATTQAAPLSSCNSQAFECCVTEVYGCMIAIPSGTFV